MEILKRRTNAARRIALVALACASFATGTCSLDWWFAPFGPGWLGLARESFDVKGAMADKVGATKAYVLKVERYAQAGSDRVFVLADSDRGRVLLVLDGETMEYLKHYDSTTGFLNELMFQDTGDLAVICGDTRIDANLVPTTVAGTTDQTTSAPIWGLGFHDSSASRYELFQPDGIVLKELWTDDIVATQAMPGNSIPFRSTTIDGGFIADAEFLATAWGSGYFFNLVTHSFIDGDKAGVYRFGAITDLLSGLPVDSGVETVSYLPDMDKQASWLTVDGLVTLGEVDGRHSLVRYPYDGSSLPIDGLGLGDTEDQRFFFDPDGKHWYVFDRWYGRLYLLETWWSK